jgi:hypothetical protein
VSCCGLKLDQRGKLDECIWKFGSNSNSQQQCFDLAWNYRSSGHRVFLTPARQVLTSCTQIRNIKNSLCKQVKCEMNSEPTSKNWIHVRSRFI